MISTFFLVIMMSAKSESLQFNGPFDAVDQCEAAKVAVEKAFTPHKIACVEVRRNLPK